ncbi:NEL-type E3 ubiquitin ligase domain-containing protein [Pseudomonas sp. NPDC089395]|uniref:NEL-type E3 ubiquitin ligase domain-containing protein n=1 Tax=Pseudomonas sp. NPDC089395 TaxID=3364460 RepID=UPI00380BD9FD
MPFAHDSIDALIARRLPTWLTSAQPEHLRKLHQVLRHQQESADQVQRVFARLPALDQFAAPLLEQALADLGIADADVRRMQLHTEQLLDLPTAAPRLPAPTLMFTSRQSLLAAALHNFHASDGQDMPGRQATLQDAQGQPLPLDFQAFARSCRQLDLGSRYQARLHQVLMPRDRPGASAGLAARRTEQLFEHHLRLQLEAAIRLAALKGEVSQACYLRLLPLVAERPIVPALPGSVSPRQLYLLGQPIEGALVLEVQALAKASASTFILWLPEDPRGTLTEHGSWQALQNSLAQRLRSSRYRRFFARFIRERNRPAFTSTLGRLLKSTAVDAELELDGRHFPLEVAVFAHLRARLFDKLFDDARVLAVPTGDEDLLDRHLRLLAMANAGLDLLNLATLFVPMLGEVMLGVVAVQMADEVYEGYRDWQLGDRQGALDHLFGVAEGVVVGAAVGAAGSAAKEVMARVPFVDALVPTPDLKLAREPAPVNGLEHNGPLLRRWAELAEESDQTATVLIQCTGLRTEQLRRLHLEHASAPTRLLDIRDRYHAAQPPLALQGQALEQHLASLQGEPSAEQAVLLRDFPGLSVRGAGHILDQASTAQRDALLTGGRVPLALAERARWHLRESRLDRACLGLHLPAAGNADSERLTLGLAGALPADEGGLATLVERASQAREQLPALLGMAPVGLGVRPPSRFADGRLGYPLSGRGASGRQAIRRGIRQIFPTLSEAELEVYLLDLIVREVNLWDHFQQLQSQLSSLRVALDEWQQQGRNLRDVFRRRRVGDALRRCWRRKVVNLGDEYVLVIEGERVGSLPVLPAGVEYAHVRRATLRGMNLATLEEDFLRRFPNLVELDLRDNQLSALPSGLEQLVQLRQLNLGNNPIVMDAEGNRRLGALTRLQRLDLSFSQLGQTPDVSRLRHLRHLHLRAAGLRTLPEARALGWQSLADLRENHIRQITEHVDSLRLRVQRLRMHDNPLEEGSGELLDQAAGRTSGTARGGSRSRHRNLDAVVREIWVGDVRDTLRVERESLWERVRQESGAADLFRFLADFSVSEDFQDHPGHYRARVWHLLAACEQHESVRIPLFREAGGPRTCDDRLLMILSQLELTVLVQRGIADAGAVDIERRLVHLGTTLLRLDQVDREAAQHLLRLRERGASAIDDIEVRLCFRVRLATALELPAQPDEMHYESFAQVTNNDLNRALQAVKAAETDQAIIDSLAERPFWQNHARERYGERFEALVDGFHQRLEQSEQMASTGGEQAYLRASNTLMRELQAAEQALMKTLAREAYERSRP